MYAEELYRLSLDPQSHGGKKSSAKVGLLHHLTGVPVFLMYMSGLEKSEEFFCTSIEALEYLIFQQTEAQNKEALLSLLPFFEEGGSVARILFSPRGSQREKLIEEALGKNRGHFSRSGLFLLRDASEKQDLICVPQASMLLSPEEHLLFYSKLFEQSQYFGPAFTIADYPRDFSAERAIQHFKGMECADAAAYYPWIVQNGKSVPPSPWVCAQFQVNDRLYGLSELPANRPMKSPYQPRIHIPPVELESFTRGRINPLISLKNIKLGDETRIWGARTLSTEQDLDFKYVSVRRSLKALKEALTSICESYVLEPLNTELKTELEYTLREFLERNASLFDPKASVPYEIEVKSVDQGELQGVEINGRFSFPRCLQRISLSVGV